MQLLVAYALDREPHDEVAGRLARVAAHYDRLWQVPVTRHGRDAGRVGMHVWDAADSPWLWPTWQEDANLAVATICHPLGYERVIGDLAPERAALPLARAVLERPHRVAELTAPFALSTLEPEAARVTLITDAVGYGPLFELRFPEGWVWSNRPAAACLFGGIRAAADLNGWRTFAATGWFMGDSTPFERVHAVPASTQVSYDASGPGYVRRRVDSLGAWAANRVSDPLNAARVSEVAEALRGMARSLVRAREGGIEVWLSGGRDSRVVAAAFLSAGVEVQLYTDASEPGEAAIAEQLVAALPTRVTHRIDQGRAVTAGQGLEQEGPSTLERALGWHRYREGLRLATFLPVPPPEGFEYTDDVRVSGATGEIAHGMFYPPDFEEVGTLPYSERVEGFIERLEDRVIQRVGVSQQAQDAAEWQLRHVLLAATATGLDDARMLDYFYAAERLRRWGSMSELTDLVVPLLVPEFVRSALDLTPNQRKENALHRAVTAELIPAWGDVPYYQRPPGVALPMLRPRLALAPDHELIGALVGNPDPWGDGHDVALVQKWWRQARTDNPAPMAERTLQRVIWRAVFDHYLAELNGEEPTSFAPAETTRAPAIRAHGGLSLRARRFTARVLRYAARKVDRA